MVLSTCSKLEVSPTMVRRSRPSLEAVLGALLMVLMPLRMRAKTRARMIVMTIVMVMVDCGCGIGDTRPLTVRVHRCQTSQSQQQF